MKHWRSVAAIAAACLLGMVDVAAAYVFPGGSRDYGYSGDWGDGFGYQPPNPYSEVAAQSRLLGQQAAMQQNMVVQSGIRNTLTTQSQAQNTAILNQRQSNRDWWFQYQTGQMAERQARDYDAPGPPARGFRFRGPAASQGEPRHNQVAASAAGTDIRRPADAHRSALSPLPAGSEHPNGPGL